MVSAVFSLRKILVAAHFSARGARLPGRDQPLVEGGEIKK